MIAIRGLAVAAVAGVAAIAFSPRSAAEPARETFTVGFRYDADRTGLDNYLAFARQAERACETPMLNTKGVRRPDRVCAEDLLENLVTRMGRPQLAEVQAQRAGLRVDSSRTLAAR